MAAGHRQHQWRWSVAAALVVVAAACGRSKVTQSSATTTTASTASTKDIPTNIPACSFANDSVSSATDLVQLQPRAAAQLIGVTAGSKAALGCGTVRASGGGTANVTFSPRVANCQFREDPASTKVGVMRTRLPDGTLLRLDIGQVTCTTAKPGQLLSLCGMGDIQPDGQVNQLIVVCNPDPSFSVWLVGGSGRLTDPSGRRFEMGAGDRYIYNFDDPASSTITQFSLSRSQTALLATQARALDVAVNAPTTTTSTTAPIIK